MIAPASGTMRSIAVSVTHTGKNSDDGTPHPCSDKALWIPAVAGMTEEGVPGSAVRTLIPAFAGMTNKRLCCHSREGGNPVILLWNFPANSLTDHGSGTPPP